MYLKEAFRYQNFLNNMISRSMAYLSQRQYLTKTKQEHMRSKVNAEAVDEVIEVTPDVPIDYNATQLIGFLEHVMEAKENLTSAISAAKRSSDIDIDAQVANNRVRQRVAEVLGRVAAIKSSERMIRGSGFKFNTDGNQVPYTYDVKEITTIDFDRNKVKGICKKIITAADEVSNQLDRAMVEIQVDYEPEFNVNDSFDDAIEQFINTLAGK